MFWVERFDMSIIENAFDIAREQYHEVGVDVEKAMDVVSKIGISMHCWQGDDVSGFEGSVGNGGGILATGAYPGKATTPDELRSDVEKAYSLIPGKHKFNLHAIYAETNGEKVERNQVEARHFTGWVDWAKEIGVGLDYNPTYFSHPMADSNFTLADPDKGIRDYWIEHGIKSREVAAYFGDTLGITSVMNNWIPDGYKDVPADRVAPRERLVDSLDKIFAKDLSASNCRDAVECKLFGIGSESYVVGSHEFYMGYAMKNKKLLCLDAGHFHPTEKIDDKISSCLLYLDEILLHVSRGVRWDSDHIITLSDDLKNIAYEIISNNYQERIYIGLDFFDASVNRVAAWVIGMRNIIKALLSAALTPTADIRKVELEQDFTSRLVMQEENKCMPFSAVWDMYCMRNNVPDGIKWYDQIKDYEINILSKRG